MGQYMSILGFLFDNHYDISKTVDCLSLYPPTPPHCSVYK